MEIVRFSPTSDDNAVAIGVRRGDRITTIAGVVSIEDLLRKSTAEMRSTVEAADGPEWTIGQVTLHAPVDGRTEVWAAGVTYLQSRDARVEESTQATVYELVYEADRPELFLKSVPWRVVTDGEPIGLRKDSTLDVPEPELALVINAAGEIVGYLVANDVSSRSIEGVNPLYIPQAKIFAGSCALSAGIRPAWEIADPYALDIALTIERGGAVGWSGTTSTSQLHRKLDELAAYLYSAHPFPSGAVLCTGTGCVPDMSFTLTEGDVVEISIAGIGTLRNPVDSQAAWSRP